MIKKTLIASSFLLASALTSCGQIKYDISHYKVEFLYKDDYKIMQLTDLHLGITSDIEKQFTFLRKNILEADPSLIILTGDIFMLANTTIVDSTIRFFDEFQINYAFTYGNHDNQGEFDSNYIARALQKSQYCVNPDEIGDDVYGYTNFYIDIKDGDNIKYRILIIDSNSYHNIGYDYKYDIIHKDQLDHFKKAYNDEEDKTYETLAFFHIPLYEFADAYEEYVKGDLIGEGSGVNNEPVSYGYERTDAFDVLKSINTKLISVGHDHVNDSDLTYKDVILSYGIKSTDEIYNLTDMIGYKTFTLNERTPISISCIENVFRRY